MEWGKDCRRKRHAVILTLVLTLAAAFLLSICIGRYAISPGEAIKIIFAAIVGHTEDLDPVKLSVV